MNTITLDKLEVESNVRSGSRRNTTAYKNLKQSISAIGMLTPITVHKNGNDNYVIIDGHQRFSVAKDLKLTDVPVYVKDTVNKSAEQVSANMFNIPMNLLEASDVIAKLMEENPDYTRKNIAGLFGKNVEWVDKAISLTNVLPEIRNALEDPLGAIDELIRIADYSLELQKKALDTVTEFTGTIWDLNSILYKLHGTSNTETYTELVPIKTFRKYEKEMGRSNTYANNLFAEYNDLICTDEDFLQTVFLNETEVGRDILADVPIFTEELEYQDYAQAYKMDKVWSSKQSFYKYFKWMSDYKYSEVELVAWNGVVANPVFYFDVKNAAEDTVETLPASEISKEKEKAAFKRQAKKFARVFLPEYFDYLKTDIDREYTEDEMNLCLKWMIEKGSLRTMGRFTPTTNEDVVNALVDENLLEHIAKSSWLLIDKLADMVNVKTSFEFFTMRYESDLEFRKNIYDCFTIATLKELAGDHSTTNKKDLVGYLAEKSDKFPIWEQVVEQFQFEYISELAELY